MNIFIFAGPTLHFSQGKEELDAVYLPPASQGDIYRVTGLKPFAIGIIDGYFDKVPSIWHKEVLWAITQGIHVFGAASMGALRAAELNAFGMKGVGRIYGMYRDGVLEDDDEVAVAHTEDFTSLSDAMVNIRCTLEKAEHQKVIGASTRRLLERMAKRMFYPNRTYAALLREARRHHVPSREISRLDAWLPTGRLDQKLDDALTMLRAIRALAQRRTPPRKATYVVEPTCFWKQLTQEAGKLQLDNQSVQMLMGDSLLEELRLEGAPYIKAMEACLLKLLLQDKTDGRMNYNDDAALLETTIAFREARGLLSPSDLRTWLKKHSLTKASFCRLIQEEHRLQRTRSRLQPQGERLIPAYLKLSGQYDGLAERALEKRRVLSQFGLEHPRAQDVGMEDDDLLEWYFRERLNLAVSANLLSHVKGLGLRDKEDFIQLLRREKCYLMYCDSIDKTGSTSPESN